ncbi:MAG: hypothetical protein ACLUHA_03330, partial [Bacteroides stercoris]
SLLGAILMFQLRRIGFYFYTAAQILMLFVLPYFAGFNSYGTCRYVVFCYFCCYLYRDVCLEFKIYALNWEV